MAMGQELKDFLLAFLGMRKAFGSKEDRAIKGLRMELLQLQIDKHRQALGKTVEAGIERGRTIDRGIKGATETDRQNPRVRPTPGGNPFTPREPGAEPPARPLSPAVPGLGKPPATTAIPTKVTPGAPVDRSLYEPNDTSRKGGLPDKRSEAEGQGATTAEAGNSDPNNEDNPWRNPGEPAPTQTAALDMPGGSKPDAGEAMGSSVDYKPEKAPTPNIYDDEPDTGDDDTEYARKKKSGGFDTAGGFGNEDAVFAAQGGAIPTYASGGMVGHYAEGGVADVELSGARRQMRQLSTEESLKVQEVADKLGVSAPDLMTVMLYETAGTLDPQQIGPVTRWGQHQGLIQWGEKGADREYGYPSQLPFNQQMDKVGEYLYDRGVRPGHDLEDIYKAVNGGNVNAPLDGRDINGTIEQHVQRMADQYTDTAHQLLEPARLAREESLQNTEAGPLGDTARVPAELQRYAQNDQQEGAIPEQPTDMSGYSPNQAMGTTPPADHTPSRMSNGVDLDALPRQVPNNNDVFNTERSANQDPRDPSAWGEASGPDKYPTSGNEIANSVPQSMRDRVVSDANGGPQPNDYSGHDRFAGDPGPSVADAARSDSAWGTPQGNQGTPITAYDTSGPAASFADRFGSPQGGGGGGEAVGALGSAQGGFPNSGDFSSGNYAPGSNFDFSSPFNTPAGSGSFTYNDTSTVPTGQSGYTYNETPTSTNGTQIAPGVYQDVPSPNPTNILPNDTNPATVTQDGKVIQEGTNQTQGKTPILTADEWWKTPWYDKLDQPLPPQETASGSVAPPPPVPSAVPGSPGVGTNSGGGDPAITTALNSYNNQPTNAAIVGGGDVAPQNAIPTSPGGALPQETPTATPADWNKYPSTMSRSELPTPKEGTYWGQIGISSPWYELPVGTVYAEKGGAVPEEAGIVKNGDDSWWKRMRQSDKVEDYRDMSPEDAKKADAMANAKNKIKRGEGNYYPAYQEGGGVDDPEEDTTDDNYGEAVDAQYANALGGSADEEDDSSDEISSQAQGANPANLYAAGRTAATQGLRYGLREMQLDQPAAVSSAGRSRSRQAYIQGAGAADVEILRGVKKAIDPKGEMPESERNIVALGTIWKYYTDQGMHQEAQRAAFSMMQSYRQNFNRFKAIAQAAAEGGDLDGAAKAALTAYAQVPDGKDLKVFKKPDNSYAFSVTDEETGKVTQQGILSPNQLLQMATRSTMASFDDLVIAAGGQPGAAGRSSGRSAVPNEPSEAFRRAMAQGAPQPQVPDEMKPIPGTAAIAPASVAAAQEAPLSPGNLVFDARAYAEMKPTEQRAYMAAINAQKTGGRGTGTRGAAADKVAPNKHHDLEENVGKRMAFIFDTGETNPNQKNSEAADAYLPGTSLRARMTKAAESTGDKNAKKTVDELLRRYKDVAVRISSTSEEGRNANPDNIINFVHQMGSDMSFKPQIQRVDPKDEKKGWLVNYNGLPIPVDQASMNVLVGIRQGNEKAVAKLQADEKKKVGDKSTNEQMGGGGGQQRPDDYVPIKDRPTNGPAVKPGSVFDTMRQRWNEKRSGAPDSMAPKQAIPSTPTIANPNDDEAFRARQ